MRRGLGLGEREGAGIVDVEPPALAYIHDSGAARVGQALHPVGQAAIRAIGNRGADQPLEHMDRPLPLARDIFRGGSISRQTCFT